MLPIDQKGYEVAIKNYLSKEKHGAENLEIVQLDIPVATGFSNETIIFTAAWEEEGKKITEKFVGRMEPKDGGMFPVQRPGLEKSCYLQHRIMKTVAEQNVVPVPAILSYEENLEPLNRSFFAMSFIEGEVPSDNPRYTVEGFLVDSSTPEERRRLIESGLKAMAGIHSIDWQESGLEWLDSSGSGNPTTQSQIDIWREYSLLELKGREHPVLEEAFNWLEVNDPQDSRVGLSWGDSRIGNIIWKNYEAAAILDWEACSLLPTEADLGWWLMFDRMSFDDMGVKRMNGYPTREEMVEIYGNFTGKETRDTHYWEVFATMRFCSIFIRLGDRLVDAGFMEENSNPAIPNMVTASLANYLGIDNPTPSIL